jgi:hypothetical protein
MGLWDTYTHGAIYWNALKKCGVDDETIYKIQLFSAGLDGSFDSQMPWNSFQHSMKAPFESSSDALQQRDNWISTNLAMAQSSYLNSGNPQPRGAADWTMFFAYAVHTITDSTSPAHMQGGNPITWPSNIPQHGDLPDSVETWKNMTPGIMKLNTDAVQAAWERVTGQKCGCQQ